MQLCFERFVGVISSECIIALRLLAKCKVKYNFGGRGLELGCVLCVV
jgi:hypothetical protein